MSQMFQMSKDKSTLRKVTDFLFGRPEADKSDQFLDMRTDIDSKEMFKALTYYKILAESYKCQSAGRIANLLERLMISSKRSGRIEAVRSIIQQAEKENTLLRGIEESLAHATKDVKH